ncbi:MAG: PQQ-dependent sugar dehydrogenase [Pseudomonadota bacterium]
MTIAALSRRSFLVSAAGLAFSTTCLAGSRAPEAEVLVQGVAHPWALAPSPDGRLFFTERDSGRIRLWENGRLAAAPVTTLPVANLAYGGLMGLALDPDFPREPLLYAMYTAARFDGPFHRIVRLSFDGARARDEGVLLDRLPAAGTHHGGRVKFGPDGKLYATLGVGLTQGVGDPANAPARDPQVLIGKILRLERDGSIPADNPFQGSPVYSVGHRNPQGLAWSPKGVLFATEHGHVSDDELNRIEPGADFGWPEVEGDRHAHPFVSPVHLWRETIAPSGATFHSGRGAEDWAGSLFVAALKARHLRRLTFDATASQVTSDEILFQGRFGRFRDVAEAADGALLVSTDNGDDVVLRVTFGR